jgi:small-conductance mechanosensitive channel
MTPLVYPDTVGHILGLAALVVFGLTTLSAVLATALITRNNFFYLGTQLVFFAVAVRASQDWLLPYGLSAIFPTEDALEIATDTVALVALAFTVDMGLRVFMWRPVLRKSGPQAVPPLLIGVVTFTIYLVAFLTIVQFVFGQSITALATLSGAFAVILGLSAQTTLGEMFAGIAIALSRPLRIGDWVKIGTLEEGRIVEMTWRLVRLETRDKNTIHITNRIVADSPIRNFSFPNSVVRIIELIYFSVGQDIPKIQKILEESIRDIPEITRTPAPQALYLGNRDGGAQFSLRYFLYDYGARDFAIEKSWKAVLENLDKAGLRHTFPLRQVEVVTSDRARLGAAAESAAAE